VRYAVSFDTTIMGSHGVVSSFPVGYMAWCGRKLLRVPSLVVPNARQPRADTIVVVSEFCRADREHMCSPTL